MISTVISGATGRMGQALFACLAEFPELQVQAAMVSARALATEPTLSFGAAERVCATADEAVPGAQLAIDFSVPSRTESLVAACVDHQVALLVGTTGLGPRLERDLDQAARRIPVMVAANTSLGVALLAALVRQAAAALPVSFDIEILEAHHRNKQDAPSGTALHLAQAAAAGRGLDAAEARAAISSERSGRRAEGQIGIAVQRGGDLVGEHQIRFLGEGEQLFLGHRATDRALFARGALAAGRWLVGQAPGRYAMRDFLGLK